LPALGNEDICRLDVAMGDPFRVRGLERVGDRNRKVEQLMGL